MNTGDETSFLSDHGKARRGLILQAGVNQARRMRRRRAALAATGTMAAAVLLVVCVAAFHDYAGTKQWALELAGFKTERDSGKKTKVLVELKKPAPNVTTLPAAVPDRPPVYTKLTDDELLRGLSTIGQAAAFVEVRGQTMLVMASPENGVIAFAREESDGSGANPITPRPFTPTP